MHISGVIFDLGGGRCTYFMVLPAILVGHVLALFTEVLLESRVHNEFLADRVAGELPGELVTIADLSVPVGGIDDLVIILLQLTVVFRYGV